MPRSRRTHHTSRTHPRSGRAGSRRATSVAPWIAVAIAVGIPLAFDPGGYFVFLPIKWALATVLVAAGLAALILERRSLPRSPVVAAWGALLVVIVAASGLGIGGVTSWIGYPGRYLGVVAWLVFFGAFVLGASLRDREDRARLLHAASAASLLVSAYALLQAAGIDPIEWSENVDVSRTRSTLGNAAFLGAYLAMIVPLAGRLALSPGEPSQTRALHAAAAVLGLVALATTQTRGAWLGVLAGIILVLVLELPRLRTTPARSASMIGAVLLAVAVLVTASPLASRVGSIVDPSTGTGRGRLTQWGLTFDLIADRPVLGWGPDTYAFTFPLFIDAEFERTVGRQVLPDRAHNVFLDLASAAGAAGVGAYLVVLGMVATLVVRTRERDAATVALAGGCIAYLVQLQFSFPLADLDTVFWLFTGLLVASVGRSGAAALSPGWAAAPVIAALLLTYWGTTDLVADRMLRRSLNAEATGSFDEAQRLIDRAADVAPARVQYLQAAGRLHRRVGELSGRADDFARGLAATDDALRLMPRDLELQMDRADLFLSWGESTGDTDLIETAATQYEEILEIDAASSRVHLKLGVAYVELGRRGDAEDEWLTASRLSPRSSGPLVNLGILYEQQGRENEAIEVLQEALELDPANSFARDALERLAS